MRLLLLAGSLAGGALLAKKLIEGSGLQPRSGTAPDLGARNGGAEATREQLYREAQRLDIEGRSKMSKDELRRAVEAARS